jgi:WD40 repeat protein
VNAVAVTPDGKRAVSASWDETLKVWDLESAALLSFTADDRLACVSLARHSRVFAGGESGEIHLLAVESPSAPQQAVLTDGRFSKLVRWIRGGRRVEVDVMRE